MSNSIGLRLLRYIFGSYLLITVIVTVVQLRSEYTKTKEDILDGLISIEQTFSAGLEEAIWNYDTRQAKLTVDGISNIDYVYAVEVKDIDGNIVVSTGDDVTQPNAPNSMDSDYDQAIYGDIAVFMGNENQRYYQHSFRLVRQKEDGTEEYLGDCFVYSSNRAVVDRVSYGFTLILINSVIKTVALWFIFYFFTRKLVAKPITQLQSITESIEPEKPQSLRDNARLQNFISSGQKVTDEIHSFALSFDDMRRSIVDKLDFIEEQNSELEQRVAERTLELTKLNKKLEEIATHDDLTGLPNRKLFHDRLKSLHANMSRSKSSYAVGIIDLRKFKLINDHYGHQAGDAYLKEFSKRFSSRLREGDTFARLGGDEFAITLPLVNAETWETTVQHLQEKLATPMNYQGEAITLQANIGIALYPEHSTDTETLIHQADLAMYNAKNADLPYQLYSVDFEESLGK